MRTAELKLINNFVDKKNPKFELNGMLLDKVNKKIVATNTRALIVYECADLEVDGILHKSAIELALKSVVGKNEKDVVFHSRDGAMYDFYTRPVLDIQTLITEDRDPKEGAIISMPTIDGIYPNYERIQFDVNGKDVKTCVSTHKTIYRDIAQFGAIVDAQYLKPLVEYMKLRDYIGTIYYREANMPVLIKCVDATLFICQ